MKTTELPAKQPEVKYIETTGFLNRVLSRNAQAQRRKKSGSRRMPRTRYICVRCGLAFIAPTSERCQCNAKSARRWEVE